LLGGGQMLRKFLGSWRIYLLSLIIPILHATFDRPCGTWKRPERCEGLVEYLDAVILDVRLHNLPVIIGFILSIFLLTSIYFFIKRKKQLGILYNSNNIANGISCVAFYIVIIA